MIEYKAIARLEAFSSSISTRQEVAEVQNAYSMEGLIIAPWVFDMATGVIRGLELDIDGIVDSIREIYSIAEKV